MTETHGPCGGGVVGEHGGPDDRHCRVCTDKSCPYNQSVTKFVYQVHMHDVTRGSTNGRDDGYPMISHLPALYATADVAQQEADLRNNTARHKPAKDKTGWHCVAPVPVFGHADYNNVLIQAAR